MHNASLIKEILEQIREALLRVKRRFTGIGDPEDFYTETGTDKLDAITMMLITIGESF